MRSAMARLEAANEAGEKCCASEGREESVATGEARRAGWIRREQR